MCSKGVKSTSQLQEVKDKAKSTYKSKYGVDHISQSSQIKESFRRTMRERYGVDNPAQLSEVTEKRHKTMLDRYGRKTLYGGKKVQNPNIEIPDGYMFLGPLSDSGTYRLRHDECGNIFEVNKTTIHTRLARKHTLCTSCNNPTDSRSSNVESQVAEILDELGVSYRRQYKVGNMILDFYVEDLNLAFEVNGVYYHSTKFKAKRYHQDRHLVCRYNGIRLIQIWEDEWHNDHSKIVGFISNIFNYTNIYARNTNIRFISDTEMKYFNESNHIQGHRSAKYSIGLFSKEGELLQAISLSRYGGDAWELIRMTVKFGFRIVGGFSRLLSRFSKSYEGSVMSYVDLDKFTGAGYIRSGFKIIGLTEPGYFYANSALNRLSRQQCQKHKLVGMGYDASMTESEIMGYRKYYKCYNSGNLKLIRA